ncbi:sensor histidine kinase [Mucilaginibacter xinganensis]|uniref:histidine kinase n=1 Tax=Mucilaginibacter xinganensis TaxID=1234841 RepID=A0A223NZV4_9SPHI|nr:HAMP domain-containing sensor histidine kinase [Mucilaginibacter xinganensis]ASU35403.1 His Kinase A (phospho-acceptor) domain-containing protein [Mucilaginibacter xinganensis]
MQSFWKKSLGLPPVFSLEARIFNAICLASATCLFFTAVLNLLLGIQQLVILMAIFFTISLLCYYFSRFKDRLNTAIVVYLIASQVLLIINYKYNSGINGPSLLIFLLSHFLAISIIPLKQYWFWITLNILLVSTLLVVDYNYHGIIIDTYPDNKHRFIDFGFTYIFIVFFIFMVTVAVRKNYHGEKKLVEEKASELEAANETMNKLFSILAHDLRSPLASIQNYLEILSEFKLNEGERLSIQKELLKSTQNTQQMLANLLSWSRSQMQGVTVNLTNLDLKKTLESTFHIYQTVGTEKGIQVINQLNDAVFVLADADMLQLIIRNLINNALKFTNPGGCITVSAETIDDVCCIVIKDNGLGISFEQQSEIFSLKTAPTFGTKNEKGIGLGLLLCKEFTEIQGGKITFESTPGSGTTFYVSLRLGSSLTESGSYPGNSTRKQHPIK